MRTKLILIALTLLIFPASTPRATSPTQSTAPPATSVELNDMLNKFLQDAATTTFPASIASSPMT